MKKQIALITISLLAAMAATAQNVNEKYDNEQCRIHNTPICEAGSGVIQPDLECLLGNCPYLPDSEVKPEVPDEPELPEIDTPILPDIEVEPEVPDEPELPEIDTPILPDIEVEPETPVIPDEPETEAPDSNLASQVLSLVNSERAKYGLEALTYDAVLTKAANIRAVEIKSLFSHTRPDGTSCFTALDEVGYFYRKAGENIAYGQSSAEEVMTAWMNSEGHRANILGDYDYIGIGVYEKGGVIYWSQMFAS